MSVPVIAIDGPAASGKSTIASLLAEHFDIPFISSGSLYRAVAFAVIHEHLDTNKLCESSLQKILAGLTLEYRKNSANGTFKLHMNGQELGSQLRSADVAALASEVAVFSNVRSWVDCRLRSFAGKSMIVMEGRDIGTAVFPDAQFKFFLTATPEARARRRLAQEGETLDGDTLQSVTKAIAERDYLDSHRKIAPLHQADDAVLIDSSDMKVEQVLEIILEKIHEKI